MGLEALEIGTQVLFGPTVNMQRSSLGGRGFESFSKDPVLAGYALRLLLTEFVGLSSRLRSRILCTMIGNMREWR